MDMSGNEWSSPWEVLISLIELSDVGKLSGFGEGFSSRDRTCLVFH